MQEINTIVDLRRIVNSWRLAEEQIAFIPTMGNLHAGHLQLVEEAQKLADRVVVSIFVNPTQFGVGEDFEAYPRTEKEDRAKLAATGIDLLFMPAVREIYGHGIKTTVSVKSLSALHCGVARPGHFDGVATVVCKLFNIVQPDLAVFGQKDFQQLAIIRSMVQDLNIPIEIKSVATVREASGLALSSRNGYLSPEQLQIAPMLYQVLCDARDEVILDGKPYQLIEQEAANSLRSYGFQTDYFSICKSSDLLAASKDDNNLVILAAARLGKTRLIDNIQFQKK
jgi:pantoate--beta-alanine ligase